MLGLKRPGSGTVLYDGKDLQSLDARDVRQQIGVVMQGPRPLPGEIMTTILGDQPGDEQHAWAAAEAAELATDIRRMPMKMRTIVGEGGLAFSGGQVQRIMIARALARRPRVIFLDEATSALDDRVQAAVGARHRASGDVRRHHPPAEHHLRRRPDLRSRRERAGGVGHVCRADRTGRPVHHVGRPTAGLSPSTGSGSGKAAQLLIATRGLRPIDARTVGGTLPYVTCSESEKVSRMQDELASGTTKLTGRLVFPGSPDYESARLLWARQFSKFPLAIVFCQNVHDVVHAMSWCREHDVGFRARSGGHALEGWSSLDGGVVIDVSDMNRIAVDERARVATVQTGATQGAVVDALGQIGYAFPSGGEVDPGVAGVLLGGGIGLLSRSMGLACDHLLGVEMVIPSGKQGAQVIQADERKNADLLWASRGGGGGNFGIATSFTLDIQPISTVTIYEATWGWRHLSELLSVWQDLAPSADERFDSVLVASSKAAGIITSYGMFIGSEEAQLRDLLQPLLGIGEPEVTIKVMSYLDAFKHFAFPTDPPKNDKFSSVWVYDSFPSEAIETVRSFLTNAPHAEANIWCLAWGGAVGRIPTGDTAFFHRKARYYMEWDAPWSDAGGEKEAMTWVERFRLALSPFVKGSYINVPDSSINDLRTYYGDNFARLQKVKRKYDPENVLRFEQSIPPGGETDDL